MQTTNERAIQLKPKTARLIAGFLRRVPPQAPHENGQIVSLVEWLEYMAAQYE